MKPIKQILQLCLFLPIGLFAQKNQHQTLQIQSGFFDAQRQVKVFLPERYFKDSTEKFMVTYVLDAQDEQVWHMATGIIDYLVSRSCVIPMIAVGIVSENRGWEFNPEIKVLPLHLEKEVFPLIEAQYRVLPFKSLVGHSWGGAFVGNTLFGANKALFDAYIGLSPSFDAMDDIVFTQAESMLHAGTSFSKYFYFSSGNVGFDREFAENVSRMDSLLRSFPNKTLAWKSALFDGADHFSTFAPALTDALVSMSRNYFADQKIINEFAADTTLGLALQMENFYANKQYIFGFSYKPGVKYWKYVADELKEEGRFEPAIELYHMALDLEPENVRINFNLADAYYQSGKMDEAKATARISMTLLENQKAAFSEIYYSSMSKLGQQILDEN